MSRNERNGIAPRFYSSRIFSTVGKIFVESNRDGEITVTRFKDSTRVQERIYIYIYINIYGTPRTTDDSWKLWPRDGEQRIGYIDVRFIIAVKFPRRERLISLCERSSPIHRDEMISLIAFGYVHICLF